MTIRNVDGMVLLEEVCTVEDAEALTVALQTGAVAIEWSDCTHLHTACLQVILAAGVPVRGVPAGAALACWLPSIFLGENKSASPNAEADHETTDRTVN